MSERWKFVMSFSLMSLAPSTISLTRPDRSRAVSWRCSARLRRRARSFGMSPGLDDQDHQRDQSQHPALQHDEQQRRAGLADEESGRREGLADEAAQRVDLVLDHRGDFGAPHPPVLGHGEAQDPVDELVAQTAQHALAEAALVGVDVELEQAVDDDVAQEGHAQRDQGAHAVELEALEQRERALAERIADLDRQHHLRGGRRFEALALDRPVDDPLGNVEGEEVGRHGKRHDDQDPHLLTPGVRPDVPEQVAFHPFAHLGPPAPRQLRIIRPAARLVKVPFSMRSCRYLYGSAASRRPSPRKLKASTTRMTGSTGHNSQG